MTEATAAPIPMRPSTIALRITRSPRKNTVRRLRSVSSGTRSTRTRGSSPGSAAVVSNENGGYSSRRKYGVGHRPRLVADRHRDEPAPGPRACLPVNRMANHADEARTRSPRSARRRARAGAGCTSSQADERTPPSHRAPAARARSVSGYEAALGSMGPPLGTAFRRDATPRGRASGFEERRGARTRRRAPGRGSCGGRTAGRRCTSITCSAHGSQRPGPAGL